MYTSVNISENEAPIKKSFIITLAVMFFACWFIMYYGAPLGFRVGIVIVMLFIQILSFHYALAFFLMALIIPFFADLFNDVGQGLDPYRFMFFPFLFYALSQRKIRNFPINNQLIFLILLSLVLLQLTSAYQILVRNMPLSEGKDPSVIDVLALAYDNVIKLAFLYFIYTRLGYKQLQGVLLLFVFLIVLEAVSVLHMTFEYRGLLHKISSRSILWINPFFGHKNEWSIIFVFVLLFVIIKIFDNDSRKWFWMVAAGIISIAIAVSLSRQAYVWTILAFLLTAYYKRNSKIIVYMIAAFLALIIFQPGFLFNRMEAMISASSAEEFQELNSKVGDEAINQLIDNFKIVPQMFVKEWEYNVSEGFWNGLLHQQGILGLFFILYIYYFIFMRFQFFYSLKDNVLRSYSIYGIVSIILVFFGNLNRRLTHFMHYKGEISQIGLFMLFMILLSELTYHQLMAETKKQPKKRTIDMGTISVEEYQKT